MKREKIKNKDKGKMMRKTMTEKTTENRRCERTWNRREKKYGEEDDKGEYV